MLHSNGFQHKHEEREVPRPRRPFIPSSAGFLDAAAQRPLSLWQQRQQHPILTTSKRRGTGVAVDRAAAYRGLPFSTLGGKSPNGQKRISLNNWMEVHCIHLLNKQNEISLVPRLQQQGGPESLRLGSWNPRVTPPLAGLSLGSRPRKDFSPRSLGEE